MASGASWIFLNSMTSGYLLDQAVRRSKKEPCLLALARTHARGPHLKMGMTQEKSGMPTFSLPKQPALSEMPMAVIASRARSARPAL